MSASLREIVDEAQKILGEVTGAGVQTYSDDRMYTDAIQIFDMLHKKRFWDQFIDWKEFTLDGTTGRITDANGFNFVKDFEDIFGVYPSGSAHQLSALPLRSNPFLITGTTPRYVGSVPANDPAYIGKRIVIWPKAATGKIQVGMRVYPLTRVESDPEHDWAWDDIMELDKWMLVHGTAWRTLSSDDLNPKSAADQQALMEARYNDITSKLADNPIPIGSQAGVPQNWFVSNPWG